MLPTPRPSPPRPLAGLLAAAAGLLVETPAPARSPPLSTSPAAGVGPPCPLPVPVPTTPHAAPGVPAPAWDLRCIELLPTARGEPARGVVTIGRPPSPFGVTVDADGRHVHELEARIEGLPDPASLGPYTTYVAWATPLSLDPVVRLAEVVDGTVPLGRVAFGKYLILVSAEASPDALTREGPLVLRGRSPSSRMEAHDLLASAPAAEGSPPGGAAGAAGPDAGHRHGAGGWPMAPAYPGVPMLPGIMALLPDVSPLDLEAPDEEEIPRARPPEVVRLPDGGALDLTAGFVRRTIAGEDHLMLAFNGQQPGPLVRVAENTTIFVNFTNRTPFPTAVHWHGVRLDNRYDGVPGVTQEPVPPGGRFEYRVRFPDAGVYWYHPHHREDVQQELGLAGNLVVDPPDPTAYGPVNREEVLMLDDLLVGEEGVSPFGREAASHALMGRFGNVLLVNGEPSYRLQVRRGEVVRFFLTNAASARTFNVSLRRPAARAVSAPAAGAPLPLKVVASDVSRFEREERTESVVLGPAERYVVHARFPEAGTYVLVNQVQGIDHRRGVFLEERTELGRVDVSAAGVAPAEDHGRAFAELATHAAVVADVARYRPLFDGPPDREIVLSLELDSLPLAIEQSMRYDWVYFNPVEWTGTMPAMNRAVSARRARWIVREPSSGRENMDIDWRFRVGEVVRIRIHNDRSAFHAMQHPFHIHGQRFLVLRRDGAPVDNRVWKDTVLLPAGSVTDILLELSNPGRWMAHCHIAEHLESGMKFVFDVEGGDP